MNDASTVREIPLSEREIEILRLLATGITNQQLAAQLDIAPNTVKVHLRNIYAKIGVNSRTEASMYAARMGLIAIESPRPQPPAPVQEQVTLPAPEPAPEPVAPPVPTEPAEQPAVALMPAPVASSPIAAEPVTPVVVVESPGRRLPAWVFALAAVAVLAVLGLIVLLVRPMLIPGTPTSAATAESQASWQPKANPTVPRSGFAFVPLNNRLYAIGGRSAQGPAAATERYSLEGDVWTRLRDKPTPVTDVQGVALGGTIYVPGGALADGQPTDVFEMYNPDRDIWEPRARLPAPRSAYGLAVIEGAIYLFGGWDGTAFTSTVWAYDAAGDRWQERTPMPDARGGVAVSVIGSRAFVAGGRDATGPVALFAAYDPTRDRQGGQPWQVLPPLPQPIAEPSGAAVLSQVYVFAPDGTLSTFNVASESWTSGATPVTPAEHLAVTLLNTDLHIIGTSGTTQPTGYHAQSQVITQIYTPYITK